MNININELRRLTHVAIVKGQNKADAEQREREAKAKAKAELEEAEAAAILSTVPSLCERAASEGKNWATVYTTSDKPDRYSQVQRLDWAHIKMDEDKVAMTGSAPWNQQCPIGVCRKIALVYRELDKAGLRPTLKWDYDGGGNNDWWNLVVTW